MSTNPALTNDLQTLAALGALGVQRSYRKGATIFVEGEQGDAVYVILKGRVRVFGAAANGKEITYGIIEAGDYFGEMALDGGQRSASVEALELCQCAVIPNAQVLAFAHDNRDFSTSLLHKTISRARSATIAARDMALLDVYGRLLQTLNHLSQWKADTTPPKTIQPIVTHADLASMVGASREMVSKLLKDLELGGYITINARQITLLKKLPPRW